MRATPANNEMWEISQCRLAHRRVSGTRPPVQVGLPMAVKLLNHHNTHVGGLFVAVKRPCRPSSFSIG